MTERPPLVSIGLPVYNGERFIRQALDSLLGQTFTDFELIVSDNGSEDATSAILSEYAARDRRIRYSRNERNLGAKVNFERVFELATGEYFMLASHDDWWEPGFIRECLTALNSNPQAVLCFPQTVRVDEEGRETEVVGVASDVSWEACGPLQRFHALLRYPMSIYGLFRREALRGLVPPPAVLAPDCVLMALVGLRGPFIYLPERLFFYRTCASNVFDRRRLRLRRLQQIEPNTDRPATYMGYRSSYTALVGRLWTWAVPMPLKILLTLDASLWFVSFAGIREAGIRLRGMRGRFLHWSRPVRHRLNLRRRRGRSKT